MGGMFSKPKAPPPPPPPPAAPAPRQPIRQAKRKSAVVSPARVVSMGAALPRKRQTQRDPNGMGYGSKL